MPLSCPSIKHERGISLLRQLPVRAWITFPKHQTIIIVDVVSVLKTNSMFTEANTPSISWKKGFSAYSEKKVMKNGEIYSSDFIRNGDGKHYWERYEEEMIS